jgi:hypothetical protein
MSRIIGPIVFPPNSWWRRDGAWEDSADGPGRHATPVSSCYDGRWSHDRRSLVIRGTSGGTAIAGHANRTSARASDGTDCVADRSPADGCGTDGCWRSLGRIRLCQHDETGRCADGVGAPQVLRPHRREVAAGYRRLSQQAERLVTEGGLVSATAYSAIEQALWDVTGKSLDVPTYTLFGGKVRDSLQVYANVNRATKPRTPAGFAAAALAAVREGFRAVKPRRSTVFRHPVHRLPPSRQRWKVA